MHRLESRINAWEFAPAAKNWLIPIGLALALLMQVGCERPDTTRVQKKTGFVDDSVAQLQPLGWLGAKTHPLNEPIRITDPDNEDKLVTPGGIVVVELSENSPLAQSGVEAGDVILRVAENWIPIKEDPVVDTIGLVERQISAGKTEISIGVYRSGEFESLMLTAGHKSIDAGLPLPTQRFTELANSNLTYLAAQQNSDGGIGECESDSGRMVNTALAGLAFLAADDASAHDYKGNVEQAVAYFADRLNSGSFDVDPLTAAYVILFLAESKVNIQDLDWLDRISKLTVAIESKQDESGGWMVASTKEAGDEAESDSVGPNALSEEDKAGEQQPQVDIPGTYATNHVLLAIGALERKGFSGENSTVEKAVGFLHEQTKLRVPAPIDRRIKAALSVGTAAAMVAVNCDRNDSQIQDYLKTALERAHDLHTSPTLGLSGLLHMAIACRQLGNDSWLPFFDRTKYLLVAMSDSEGKVIAIPGAGIEALPFEQNSSGPVWWTAHAALIASMQSQRLQRMLAISKAPMQVSRDGDGKKIDASKTSSGVQPMKINGSSDAEELKKMIMERLKEQGIDVDETKLKIQRQKK